MASGFEGRTAIVTGGSKGIGLAVARLLAVRGANVVIASRRIENLTAAQTDVVAACGDDDRVLTVQANAGDDDDAARCVAATIERFGAVDLLVNNAATNPYAGPLVGLTAAAAEKTAKVNQWGIVNWTQQVWNAHMAAHGGAIVNIASIGGLSVDGAIGYYNATKAAVIHLTRQLAHELSPTVRVNCVAPGLVKTDMARSLWEVHEERIAASTPLRRLGEPDDIARGVAFLLGPDASWITGQTLVIDGGAMIRPLGL